jgi:hypothetical protein
MSADRTVKKYFLGNQREEKQNTKIKVVRLHREQSEIYGSLLMEEERSRQICTGYHSEEGSG